MDSPPSSLPPPPSRAHPNTIALHHEGDHQSPAAAAAPAVPHSAEPAAAAAAAPASAAPPSAAAAAAAAVEPDDPTVPRWDRTVIGFGPFLQEVVRAGNQSTMLQLPDFHLLGYKWHLDLYPLRPGGFVGAFLKYIGKSPGNDSDDQPAISFRVVALHRDVVAETDRLNAAIKEQRKEAAQRAFDTVTEASGVPASPPSTAAVQAAAELFPLLPYPSSDPRNVEVVQLQPHRYFVGEDYGFKEWIDHKEMQNFLCGPSKTLHFCVLMEDERRTEAASGRIRKLSSFLGDAGVGALDLNAPQLHWPYLGLLNQGRTGYVSAVMQILFHLPQFRRAVYSIPVDAQQMLELIEPDDGSSAAAASGSSLAVRSPSPVGGKISIPLALQHLFFLLQTGRKAVDTRTLTKSLGWNPGNTSQQHDVQEFSRVLLAALDESVVKQQPPMSAITRLFEGKQQTFIECQNVAHASTRVESFLDLALNVKGAGTLHRSFDEYVAEELMHGSNQYRAVDKDKGIDFGMQDARKGVRFLRFPQVLQIQLKRFELDFEDMETYKIDDKFGFPTRLDLTQMEWGEEESEGEAAEEKSEEADAEPAASKKPRARKPADPLDPAIYHLHSVLVHSGSISNGRHSVFVRPFLDDPTASYEDSPWLKFDDETVSICADAREATEKNFGGGEYVEVVHCLGKKMTVAAPSNSNAYMLVYIRQKLVANKGFSEPADHFAAAAHTSHSSSALAACGSTGAAVEAEFKDSQDSREVYEAAPMDLDDGAASPTPEAVTVSAGRAASRCFTANPPDLRSFIESLTPVAVPPPQHIFDARKRKRELAMQFKLEVLVESDIVWQGFGSGAGRGGVAGLDLTVAPALDAADPQPLALRDFLFSAPHKEHTFKRTDTIGSVRAKLAEEAGLPLERVQLWQVHRKAHAAAAGLALRRHQCDYLHDDSKQLSSLTDSPLMAAQGMPLLLVRDRLAVDQDESLSKVAVNAGKIEGAHRSLDPSTSSGAGQSERILLLFKFFDVHSQRMVTIGSAILWKHMSVQHLKQFLMALLQSRGIDLESRCRLPAPTTVDRFEQLRRVGSASAAASNDQAADVDMPPAGASTTLPFLVHMHRLGANTPPFGGAPAGSTPPDEVAEVQDVSSKNALSWDEQRCANWIMARMNSIAAPPVIPANFAAPMLHLVEEAECIATAMRDAVEGASAAAAAANANLLKVKDAAMTAIERLQNNASTLRECGLINGSVLIVEPQMGACELSQASLAFSKQFLRIHLADGGSGAKSVAPSTPTSSSDSTRKQLAGADLSTAAAASSSSASAAGSDSPMSSTSVAALRDPLAKSAASTSPLLSALLDPLPAHASFHPNARSYLHYLLHRWLVEFQPAVLDPVTMERAPLDPATSPLHPAAALGSVVMEVSTAWTLDHMRSQLAQRVSALVSPAIRASYPQVSNAHCYKLWKPSRQFPGTIFVKDGDVTRKILSGSQHGVAHALVAQINVDGLGPLEQLVRSQSTRSAVQSLFFELSAVSLCELEDNWWLQPELVDERGEVHRLPSPFPGLCAEQPFLVPKRTDFLLGHLRQLIYDQFIVAHRPSLPLAHYALLGADGQPLLPPAADAATEDSVKAEPSTSASKRRAEAANGTLDRPAAKKLKNEDAQAAPASVAGDDAMVAASSVASSSVSLTVDDLCLHVYVPNAPPPSLAVTFYRPPPAMAHFLLPWSNWHGCPVTRAAAVQLRAFFDRARTATPKGSHVRHPAIFADRDLNASQYAQPLPFRITCHLQPTPADSGSMADAFVFRFTTLIPADADGRLPPKQSFAFSSLPPVLTLVDKRGDDVHSFQQRLARQLGRRCDQVQLALLRPRHYELIAAGSAAAHGAMGDDATAAFGQWLSESWDRSVQLGVFEPRVAIHRTFSWPNVPILAAAAAGVGGAEESAASPAATRSSSTAAECSHGVAPLCSDPHDDELAALRRRLDSAEAQAAAAMRTVAQRVAGAADQTEAMQIVQRQLSVRDAQLDELAAAQLAEAKRLRDQHESATKKLRESLQLKCGVCYERRPNVLYQPCRHVFCCAQCDAALVARKCPKCNGIITETIGVVFIEAD